MEKLPDIRAAGRQLRDRTTSALELTERCLKNIKERDSELHAFITVTEREAIERASQLDKELGSGVDRGPLHGIPIALKDNLDTAGIRTTIGSGIFAGRIPDKDAAVVSTLDRAGAIVVGKTNLPEFASDPAGRNSNFGDPHNPYDTKRSAGGSSGGTAIAVATGMCVAGIGSDTGGSIRMPAGWCGIVGLRPTYGTIGLEGIFPRAPSLDTVGPMTQSAFDCALMMDALSGSHSYTAGIDAGSSGIRLGTFRAFPGTDPEIVAALSAAIDRLVDNGAKRVEVSNPLLSGDADDSDILDVLFYEFNEAMTQTNWPVDRPEDAFSSVVRANIARGKAVSAEKYRSVLALRPKLLAEARALFERVDAIVTPTSAVLAPLLSEDNPKQAAAARRFTLASGFLGLPSLSIPCGFTAAGLPIGLQLTGDLNKEAMLLRIGYASK